ncbi:hypothetical protein LQW54_008514 [Pestalotiopsis sp. IQ-011]
MTANPEEEAWTFVSSKRNRQSKRRAPPVAGTISHASAPVRTTPNLPLEDIRTDYKKFSQQWTDSKCCRKLKEVLQSKSCHPHPQKAICLGLGSFDPEDGSWQTRRRSHIQLAAFATLVESLEKDPKEKMRCIFQEPCFTASDIEFLKSLGYEVLDSPGGFEAVSEDSIVFGIHLYRDIYTAAIEKAIPTMFIGTGYDVWESYADDTDQSWSKMKQLDGSCDKIKFPDDQDFYPTFTSTTIHWRKPKDDGLEDITKVVGSLTIGDRED